VLVVTRFRVPDSTPAAEAALREGLEKARGILAAATGNVTAEVGRNLDEPDLWVLVTRWANVGSYRRAIGSFDGKMHVQPLMVHALDEPSAYEVVEEGTEMNEASARSLG
jgi:hypothetical protein